MEYFRNSFVFRNGMSSSCDFSYFLGTRRHNCSMSYGQGAALTIDKKIYQIDMNRTEEVVVKESPLQMTFF